MKFKLVQKTESHSYCIIEAENREAAKDRYYEDQGGVAIWTDDQALDGDTDLVAVDQLNEDLVSVVANDVEAGEFVE